MLIGLFPGNYYHIDLLFTIKRRIRLMLNMGLIRRAIFVLFLFAFSILISACQESQSPEAIHGVWNRTNRFLRFNEDGNWAVAYTRSLLDNNPFDWGTYTFDGKTLIFSTDDEAESCAGLGGVWEVNFPNDTDIEFIEVEEECNHRFNDFGKHKYQRYSPQ
jgi:hypothetical protein